VSTRGQVQRTFQGSLDDHHGGGVKWRRKYAAAAMIARKFSRSRAESQSVNSEKTDQTLP
jgi:hypothetical protein